MLEYTQESDATSIMNSTNMPSGPQYSVPGIIGGTVGGALVILLVLVLAFACLRKMSAKGKEVANLQMQLKIATQPIYT